MRRNISYYCLLALHIWWCYPSRTSRTSEVDTQTAREIPTKFEVRCMVCIFYYLKLPAHAVTCSYIFSPIFGSVVCHRIQFLQNLVDFFCPSSKMLLTFALKIVGLWLNKALNLQKYFIFRKHAKNVFICRNSYSLKWPFYVLFNVSDYARIRTSLIPWACLSFSTPFWSCTVATSRLALCWVCYSPRTGCARRTTPIYMWCEQAMTEWSWHVNSIVACCHSVKLCALAARDFRSQQDLARSNALVVTYLNLSEFEALLRSRIDEKAYMFNGSKNYRHSK